MERTLKVLRRYKMDDEDIAAVLGVEQWPPCLEKTPTNGSAQRGKIKRSATGLSTRTLCNNDKEAVEYASAMEDIRFNHAFDFFTRHIDGTVITLELLSK